MQSLTPVTRNILLACVGVFLLQLAFGEVLEQYFALWPLHNGPYSSLFEPWQLVTYAFLHGGFEHLFFNMFALYMFGPSIERLIGPRRFFVYYLVCVISAAVAQILVLNLIGNPQTATVGASGGIFGLLLAFGLAFPRQIVRIYFILPMPAWLFVTIYGLLELYLGVSGKNASVAHFAHLGGMIGGFVLILYWRMQKVSR